MLSNRVRWMLAKLEEAIWMKFSEKKLVASHNPSTTDDAINCPPKFFHQTDSIAHQHQREMSIMLLHIDNFLHDEIQWKMLEKT